MMTQEEEKAAKEMIVELSMFVAKMATLDLIPADVKIARARNMHPQLVDDMASALIYNRLLKAKKRVKKKSH